MKVETLAEMMYEASHGEVLALASDDVILAAFEREEGTDKVMILSTSLTNYENFTFYDYLEVEDDLYAAIDEFCERENLRYLEDDSRLTDHAGRVIAGMYGIAIPTPGNTY